MHMHADMSWCACAWPLIVEQNNELSYRRRTSQHAMFVNSCYVKVIQGHWQWCHSMISY